MKIEGLKGVRYSTVKRPSVKEKEAYFMEIIPEDTLTEQAHMPARVQLERLMAAGEQLLRYRRDMYDFGFDEDGAEVADPDPTRSGDFDMAEASMILSEVEERLTEQARRQKKAAEEAAKAVKDEEQVEISETT